LEIMEENNYYPFGLKHKGYNNVITGRDHKYGFGGKEYQDELNLDWYDVEARNYDAALGRWMNIDPLAEKYYDLSLYNYSANSPILLKDTDGKQIIVSANRAKAIKDLARIGATKRGFGMIQTLMARGRTRIGSVFFTTSSQYDTKTQRLDYAQDPWSSQIDGSIINSYLILGHELRHAYGNVSHGVTGQVPMERDAVNFGNYMRKAYGIGPSRKRYKGIPSKQLNLQMDMDLFENPEEISNYEEGETIEAGGSTFMSASFTTTTGRGKKKKSTTNYTLSVIDENGTFAMRKFDNKDDFDEANKRVQKLKEESKDN